MNYTQPEVQDLLTARAAQLTPLATYANLALDDGGNPMDAWREADEPLVPEDGPETWLNLNYYFDDREQLLDGYEGALSEYVQQIVVFRFVYDLGVCDRRQAWQRAALAGEHQRGWMVREWHPDIEVKPASGVRMTRTWLTKAPVQEVDGELRPTHVLVEIPFIVTYKTAR